jgi:hypothetical protein
MMPTSYPIHTLTLALPRLLLVQLVRASRLRATDFPDAGGLLPGALALVARRGMALRLEGGHCNTTCSLPAIIPW